MTYTPSASDYQQLTNGDPHGGVDCTAWSAAWLVDAQTAGKHKVTGTQVRAATNEATPDPASPGLNLPQVDRAVQKLTGINFDTRLGESPVTLQPLIVDGAWMELQVIRGVLVDANYGGHNGFRGGHAITIHYVNGRPVIGDPLVPWYMRASWGVVWRAAFALAGQGRANAMLTSDLTADWTVSLHPTPPHRRLEFAVFSLNAAGTAIKSRHFEVTAGFSANCTPPKFFPWDGHVGASLVQITTGSRKGDWVRSKWATKTPGSQP